MGRTVCVYLLIHVGISQVGRDVTHDRAGQRHQVSEAWEGGGEGV